MTSILDVIGHYQRSIEKSAHDEARLLHCIEKLYKLPITVEHLQQTGIGKTVNALRKYDKEVGVAAKALVSKWKAMVAAEEELADEEDAHKPHDHPSNSDSDNYNGSQYSVENQNGRYNRQNPQSSSRSDVDSEGREKKHKGTRKDESRSNSRSSTADMKKSHNALHDRHSNDKIITASISQDNRGNPNDMLHHRYPEHHSDRRKDGKRKMTTEDSNRKVRTPEPVDESPPPAFDDNLYENDVEDDDEDDEKLVIDTEHSKEIENVAKPSSRESSKSSKSHHKTSSKRKSNDENPKESEHYNRKRHTTDERHKDKDLKESKAASSSKSQNGEKVDHDKSEERHHKSDKKEVSKTSDRHNGKHKSSSKSKYGDKSKENDTVRESSGKNQTESSSKESSRSNSKKSSKRKHHSSESSDSDSEKSSPKKAKSTRNAVAGGIDNSMGNLSFEEALGMMAPPAKLTVSKLKSPKANGIPSTSTSSATSTSRGSSSSSSILSKPPPLLTSKAKLEPLDLKLSLELPTISPNYKPMPLNPTVMDCVFPNNLNKVAAPPPRRLMTDDEALASGIQSKTMRTKIYSGIKSGTMFQVPTLFQLCIRVLQKNIDALEYTGGVPFEVLKSVLELASPEQLQTFEEFNPYLLPDTDELWKVHCGRRYKTKKRNEYESWKEMFARCKEEDEVRLSLLTKNISFQQKQISAPIKRTQLAYVDVDVKPPRNIQRKQEQYGTKGKLIATPAARVEALSKINPSVAKIGDTRLRTAADMRDYAQASSHIRPKKAPLMQKTLQLMKGRFKR